MSQPSSSVLDGGAATQVVPPAVLGLGEEVAVELELVITVDGTEDGSLYPSHTKQSSE